MNRPKMAPKRQQATESADVLFATMFRAMAEVVRCTPNPLPGKVSEWDAAQIAAACADRILMVSSRAIRVCPRTGDTLQ